MEQFSVTAMYAWTDSTVCLYWIKGDGVYKQFVTNRVNKIREKNACWRHVPTIENAEDIGSRGCNQLREKWMKGPQWLSEPSEWPPKIVSVFG